MSSILEQYINQKREIERLQHEIHNLNEEKNRIYNEKLQITSEPYYNKAMKFRTNVKKTILYKIYSRVRYGKIQIPQQQENVDEMINSDKKLEFDYSHMLWPDEYRFLKYKQKRNKGYRLDLSQIRMPYIKKLVSVILPVYNGEDYIKFSIDSVLNQTYNNFELIIIDDGSSDSTPKIIDEYAQKDDRIKVIHQENRKLPRTLSRGFREARGEYLTWTSADNIMHMNMLEKFVADMEKYTHTGMLYGNLKLIDEKGAPKTDFSWYAFDEAHPEHVLFQKNIMELNTYANNYIGASFMYRAVVANVVEDYSAYKYGIEDYDYWMKINELFTLRHTSFDEPAYSYRMHPKSLTSKDKELKITENRYKQMLLDDFRRDFYLKQQMWIIESTEDKNEVYCDLIKCIKKNGQKIVSLEEAKKQTPNLYDRFIYVKFDENCEKISSELPEGTYKVVVTKNVQKAIGGWDCYITVGEVNDKDFIEAYKGWYGISHGEDIVAFVDSKAKNAFLYELEGDGAKFVPNNELTSVVISYMGNDKNFVRCMDSVIESNAQTEIIVVGKSPDIDTLEKRENVKYVSCISENDVTRKNIASRMAQGKYIFFLQEDCIVEEDYFEKMQYVFDTHPKVSGVYGNVEVVSKRQNIQYATLLGEYQSANDDVYFYSKYNMPSPFAFAIKNSLYKTAGGFYHCNDKYEDEFCGIEYMGMCFKLERAGYYTMISGDSNVYRYVEEVTGEDVQHIWLNYINSRYNLEINTALEFDTWPEGISVEPNDINFAGEYGNEIVKINKELRDRVRSDFREREKVELNRDIFSQPV